MMEIGASVVHSPVSLGSGHIGRIPVRNLWLLMLYASAFYRHLDKGKIAFEDNPDDIPDLIAEILARAVERRLLRSLSVGYQTRKAVLGRLRGRIDLLSTERHQLLSRGKVACRFDDLTVNTPRNRFVRAALDDNCRNSKPTRTCASMPDECRWSKKIGCYRGKTQSKRNLCRSAWAQ